MSRKNPSRNHAVVVCQVLQKFAYELGHTCRMSSKGAENLARHVLARREQLDLTQLEVHAAGGPSNTWQTLIEGGRIETLSRSTARKLDAGLHWEPGSARRVWEGGKPTPARNRGSNDLRRRIAESALDAETKAAILALIDSREPPPASPESHVG